MCCGAVLCRGIYFPGVVLLFIFLNFTVAETQSTSSRSLVLTSCSTGEARFSPSATQGNNLTATHGERNATALRDL